jgi:hypothetical protein
VRKRTLWILAILWAPFLTCIGIASNRGEPIHLLDHPEDLEGTVRKLCTDWLPTRYAPDGLPEVVAAESEASPRQWWIAVTPGSALYAELHAAKGLLFEMDPFSGVRPVCLGREVRFADERSNVVRALLRGCGTIRKLRTLTGPASAQVAIALRDRSPNCAE